LIPALRPWRAKGNPASSQGKEACIQSRCLERWQTLSAAEGEIEGVTAQVIGPCEDKGKNQKSRRAQAGSLDVERGVRREGFGSADGGRKVSVVFIRALLEGVRILVEINGLP